MTLETHAAFFDFDGTLIAGDSQTLEMIHILKNGPPSWMFYIRALLPLATAVLYHSGLVSQRIHNIAYLKTYRHVHEREVVRRSQRLFEKEIRKIFIPQSMELMEHHAREGAVIVVVSATTCQILEPVRQFIRPDFTACTALETDKDGRCTGRSLGRICIGTEKARQVRELAEMHHIDLSKSYAYSDHHADIPLLETVGFPAVVNPTARLLRIANQRGWVVHQF